MTGHSNGQGPIVEVQGVSKQFPTDHKARVHAVTEVSLHIDHGETLAVVGESGCGKSTTALSVLRMQDVTAGNIVFNGQDITHFSANKLRPIRRQIQMIYQDPFGSLNPRMKVGSIIGEPLRVHGQAKDKVKYRTRVKELMRLVGLLDDMADRYPHEFSGGQRQRIAIARALITRPSLIVADEPVSALDVSVQAQVLNLMMDLQERYGLSYLFVSHDLAVVNLMCDDVLVLQHGQLVEAGSADDIFLRPQHPYTQELLSANTGLSH